MVQLFNCDLVRATSNCTVYCTIYCVYTRAPAVLGNTLWSADGSRYGGLTLQAALNPLYFYLAPLSILKTVYSTVLFTLPWYWNSGVMHSRIVMIIHSTRKYLSVCGCYVLCIRIRVLHMLTYFLNTYINTYKL